MGLVNIIENLIVNFSAKMRDFGMFLSLTIITNEQHYKNI